MDNNKLVNEIIEKGLIIRNDFGDWVINDELSLDKICFLFNDSLSTAQYKELK